jgi:hypothetical protein
MGAEIRCPEGNSDALRHALPPTTVAYAVCEACRRFQRLRADRQIPCFREFLREFFKKCARTRRKSPFYLANLSPNLEEQGNFREFLENNVWRYPHVAPEPRDGPPPEPMLPRRTGAPGILWRVAWLPHTNGAGTRQLMAIFSLLRSSDDDRAASNSLTDFSQGVARPRGVEPLLQD